MRIKNVLLGVSLFALALSGCSNNSGSSVKYYKIVWKNYNGTVLETDERVKENTIPSYDGATPTKPEDANYTYTFKGWSPTVVKATKDATYKATFNSVAKGPQKHTVAAHTLSDAHPPVDSDAMGEQVNKTTWDSFLNGSTSFFSEHYNYTYTAYSGGSYTIEKFTKNGYYMQSSSGKLYYERISGNSFYQYIQTSEGWLRQTTTLDLQSKFTYRIQHEISVHMFDFENYEYQGDYDGSYFYPDYGFGSLIMFHGGYLTCLRYETSGASFSIDTSFKTTIDIPESYYYA